MGRAVVFLVFGCVACGGKAETILVVGSDAGAPPNATAPVDVRGIWHDCASRSELRDDGSIRLWRLTSNCTESGSYSVNGQLLSIEIDDSNCQKPTPSLNGIQVLIVEGQLVLVHPELQPNPKVYFPDSAPRARWHMTGTGDAPFSNGLSVVRIVGDTNGYSGCYWSDDGQCGGFLSCGGGIDDWTFGQSAFVGRLGCGGKCPCGAVLEGTTAASGSVNGDFLAVDCNGTYQGSFDLEPIPDG